MAADPANASAATCALDTKALAVVSRSADDPLIGREVIGQYRIEKRLGVGGMGAVYLAQQITVSRPAVIKVLHSQLGGSSDGIARFAIEAKAASSLNHPNIVTIYNYGAMEDGTLFLAMEYLAGETLAARIERCGKLPAERAVHIATQIASALGEAHAHGVVHRDVKPANVMIVDRAGEPDFVKVLDFGIAKLDDAGVTSAGYVIGTPRYMSPEQLLGKRLDCRSDVYSAGIVLYEMLAGVPPFSADSPIGWLHQHVDVEPKPPSALVKGGKISPPLDRVVLRALAKAPADRPSSMEMFALDLVGALNAPTEPPPPPWWRRAVVGVVHFAAMFWIAFAAGARKFVRAAGSGGWWFLRTLGSGTWRFARSIWSGARRFVRAIRAAARRSPSAVKPALRNPAATPIRPDPRARGRGTPMLASPGRRLLVALLVVLATVALLVALFPEVRADFGLGPDEKPGAVKPTKPRQAPAPAPVRTRDKAR